MVARQTFFSYEIQRLIVFQRCMRTSRRCLATSPRWGPGPQSAFYCWLCQRHWCWCCTLRHSQQSTNNTHHLDNVAHPSDIRTSIIWPTLISWLVRVLPPNDDTYTVKNCTPPSVGLHYTSVVARSRCFSWVTSTVIVWKKICSKCYYDQRWI